MKALDYYTRGIFKLWIGYSDFSDGIRVGSVHDVGL